ncbi:TraM recognition domain-containing protein [Acidithiobacillus sp. MC6.1]|nr:TraM recognition domain-containing protein [Acidithiobacillus sp. MC6.1]
MGMWQNLRQNAWPSRGDVLKGMVRNMYVTDDGMVRHSMIMARSGSGKTEFLKSMFYQQVLRGGGKLLMDGKLDYKFLDDLYSISHSCYREMDFRVINIENAAVSHTYNPLLRGSALTVASRIGATIETGENASAKHFKTMGTNLLASIIGAIQAQGKAFNFLDLFIIMTNPSAMDWLSKNTPPGEARDFFHIQLSSYRNPNAKGGGVNIDLNRLLVQVGGVAGQLYQYSMGDMGKVMGDYSPQVDLLDCIDQDLLLCVMIPRLEISESAQAFARMFFSDLASAIGVIYKRPKEDLSYIPFEVDMDEFGSYAPLTAGILFEVARGARVAMSPAFQTKANLEVLGDDFVMQIVGNTENKYIMQLGDPDTQEFAADIIGEKIKVFRSRVQGSSSGASNKFLDHDIFHNISKSSSDSRMSKTQYDYRIRPETFQAMPPGRGILFHAGKAFHVDFPMVKPRVSLKYQKPEVATKQRDGLHLHKRFAVDPMIVKQIQEEKGHVESVGGAGDGDDRD